MQKKTAVVLGIDLVKNSFHLYGVDEDELKTTCRNNADCQRLLTILGIGLLSVIALVAAVAVANKNARIARAVLTRQTTYQVA